MNEYFRPDTQPSQLGMDWRRESRAFLDRLVVMIQRLGRGTRGGLTGWRWVVLFLATMTISLFLILDFVQGWDPLCGPTMIFLNSRWCTMMYRSRSMGWRDGWRFTLEMIIPRNRRPRRGCKGAFSLSTWDIGWFFRLRGHISRGVAIVWTFSSISVCETFGTPLVIRRNCPLDWSAWTRTRTIRGSFNWCEKHDW